MEMQTGCTSTLHSMEDFTISTRITSHNARGRPRKLSKGRRYMKILAEDDRSDIESLHDPSNPSKIRKPLHSNSVSSFHPSTKKPKKEVAQENNQVIHDFIPSETRSFFLGQKLGSKGHRKNIQENRGKSNITPSVVELRTFYSALPYIDPMASIQSSIHESYQSKFDVWLFHLLQNSNLLLYGIGDKKDLLTDFSNMLVGQDTVYLNGCHDGSEYQDTDKLIKNVLEYICNDILKKPDLFTKTTVFTTNLEMIIGELNKYYDREITTTDPFKGYYQKNYPKDNIISVPISQRLRKSYPLFPHSKVLHNRNSSIEQERQSQNDDGNRDEEKEEEDYSTNRDHHQDSITTTEYKEEEEQEEQELFHNTIPSQRRTVIPILSTSRPYLDKNKFAKSLWKGRYRYAHPKLYILINDISGPALRNNYSQLILSKLAQCDAVGIVATTEQMNTKIMWSDDMIGRFHWVYEHIPTYKSYKLPDDFELFPTQSSILDGVANERSLNSLLTSVTVKHRELLELLAKETVAIYESKNTSNHSSNTLSHGDMNQISSKTIDISGHGHGHGHLHIHGISETHILSACKSKLILRSSAELKNILKELIDQKTVKVTNGMIIMALPLAREVLHKLQRR